MKVRHLNVYTVEIEVWKICGRKLRNYDGCVNTMRRWTEEGDKCEFTEPAQRTNIKSL